MKFSPIPVIPLPKLACSEMSCDIKKNNINEYMLNLK